MLSGLVYIFFCNLLFELLSRLINLNNNFTRLEVPTTVLLKWLDQVVGYKILV